MRILREFIGNQGNAQIRHCKPRRVLLQKVLAFYNARLLQDRRPFAVGCVERKRHFLV